MYDDVLYKFPLFTRWADKELYIYFSKFYEDFRRDPSAPPRKGTPPGRKYPLSFTKYEAAVYSVLYGTKYTGFRLNDILGRMDSPPSPGLFRVWRSEVRFKDLVEKLKSEFSKYMAKNILFNQEEPFLADYPETQTTGLTRKIAFIREGVEYSPDLMGRISSEIANCFTSADNEKKISNYLGYYIWSITLLYPLGFLGKKSPKRVVWLDVCKKIIGRHWRDEYLNQKVSLFKNRLETIEEDLNKEHGPWMFIQSAYREELAAILNGEILKMAKSNNKEELKAEIDPYDITTCINFLAGKIKFYRSYF